MSAITIDNDLVHYEVLGRGKPIILLHGWLGSWRYWVPTMQQLAMKYRCYALDLWGFGDSGKDPERYSLIRQTELLEAFIDRMGIPKVVLVGHGWGAVIAARFAVDSKTAEKVYRLSLIAPPLFESAPGARPLTANTPTATPAAPQIGAPTAATTATTSETSPSVTVAPAPTTNPPTNPTRPATQPHVPPPTSDEAKAYLEIVRQVDRSARLYNSNPLKDIIGEHPLEELLKSAVTPNSPDFEKLRVEIAKTDPKAVRASAEAFSKINTLQDIMASTVPTFTMIGENDTFLPKPEESVLTELENRQDLKLQEMPGAHHFPMLQDNAQFVRLLKDFLEAPDISSLSVKDEWRRRKR